MFLLISGQFRKLRIKRIYKLKRQVSTDSQRLTFGLTLVIIEINIFIRI
jgi:hypothetical protein